MCHVDADLELESTSPTLEHVSLLTILSQAQIITCVSVFDALVCMSLNSSVADRNGDDRPHLFYRPNLET
jgi:hypothetical protein